VTELRSEVDDPTRPARPELSLTEVVGKLGDDLTALLTTQIEIAKLEIKQEASSAARGPAMLSAGGLAAVVAVFMLSAAAAWAIAAPLNEWLGFLIVGLVWVLVGTVLVLIGRRRLREVSITPKRTVDELRADRDLARQLP